MRKASKIRLMKLLQKCSRQTRQQTYPLIQVPRLQQLQGAVIRTTIGTLGGVTATVGRYNPVSNRIQLINITSERTGVNFGTLSFLPEELIGLQILVPPPGGVPGPAPAPAPGPAPGTYPGTYPGPYLD